jgi:TolA-binding protein
MFGNQRRAAILPAAMHLAGALALLAGALATGGGKELLAQEKPADSDAGTRQYAAAVALHNRELYDLAAEQWKKFVTEYPKHPRIAHGYHYLGICYYNIKQYGEAEAAFQTVIKDQPKFEQLESTYLYLGVTQFSAGRGGKAEYFPKALATFTTLATKYPRGQFLAQTLYYRGECLYAQGKKKEAIDFYSQMLSLFPKDPLAAQALYAQGVAQEELQQWEDAAQSYAQFLTHHDKHSLATEVGMRLGETLMQRGQFAEAEKFFESAAKAEGFRLADHAAMRHARCLASRKKHAEAAAVYALLPQKFPQAKNIDLNVALLEAGKCYYLAGDYAAARGPLSKLLSAGGDTASEAAHWLARSFLKDRQAESALRVASEAAPKASPRWAAALLLDQADAQFEIPENRCQAAETYLQLATLHANDPLAAEALYMAGFTRLQLGEYQTALQLCQQFQQRHARHELAPSVQYVAAESQLLLKQYDQAAAGYQQLLQQNPQHADAPEWKVRLGLAYHAQQKYRETLATLEPQLGSLRPADLRAEALFLCGSSQAELKAYDKAITLLEQAAQADPAWRRADETQLVLAFCYRQHGDTKKAIDRLRALTEQFSASPLLAEAFYLLAEYTYELPDLPKAAGYYQTVIRRWPNSPFVPACLHGLAWTQLSQGDYAAANTTLTGLIDSHAQHAIVPRAKYARGICRHQLKQYSAAAADLAAFLLAEPKAAERTDARYVLGLCQAADHRPAEAAATLSAILKDDPNYAGLDKVRYELAWALKQQEKDAEAQRVFEELAALHPQSAFAGEALYHAGEALYAQGDFDAAAGKYLKAEEKIKELAKSGVLTAAQAAEWGQRAAHKLGWTAYRRKQFDKAEANFKYQLQTYPTGPLSADARFMLGESLFEQKKYKDALAAYAQVTDPSTRDFAALAVLHSAQAANQLQDYAAGLKYAQNFAARFSDHELLPEALCERGWALLNQNQPDEAQQVFEEVTKKTNRETAARARFLIGEIYFQKKDHKEAVRQYFLVAFGYSFPTWQANAHYEAARCFEVLGNKAQAIKSYQEIVEKHPASDKAPLAKKRLEELQRS